MSIPPFRRDLLVQGFVAVGALSRGGDTVWTVAVAWTAVHLASPAVAGLVLAAGTVPRALILLYGGVVADRVDALRLMRLTNLARTLVLAVVAVVAWAGGLSIGVLIAAVVCFGVADALYNPASSTVPRQLVRPDDLPAFYGLSQTAQRMGNMGGAVLGGVLVAVWGIGGAATVDAATFLLHACYLLLLRPRYPLERAEPESALRSIAAGFRYLRAEPATRTVVLTLSGLNLAVTPALDLGVALRASHEGWGAHTVGISEALVGLGAVAGSLLMLRYRPARIAVFGFAMLVVQGVGIVLLGVGDRTLLFAGDVLIGITAGAASASLGAVFATVVAPAYLGRMSSIQALGDDVFMPVANAAFGAVAAATVLAVPFLVFGGAMSLLMLAVLRNPTIRGIGSPAGEPRAALSA